MRLPCGRCGDGVYRVVDVTTSGAGDKPHEYGQGHPPILCKVSASYIHDGL